MNLVHLYGPPAVGKLTVATALARRTGYKLFHNHLSIGAIAPIFEFGTPTFWRLLHQLRDDVMESAAKEDISLIYTAAYTQPDDIAHFERRKELIERYDGTVMLIKLTCARPVLEGRVEAESRRALRKLSDLGAWRSWIEGKDIDLLIPGRDSLVIDNTDLSPEEVAMRIIRHYALPEETNT
jgi:hypothetical protein